MSEKIVVGLTDTPVSNRVVDWAVARAAERKQPIELLSVVGDETGATGEDAVVRDAVDAIWILLDAAVERVSAAGVEVSARIETGNPVAKLLAASEDAGLLVIGSHYRGPDSRTARGVHGIRIAAGAHCPVVIVPNVELGERRGVVVGDDGSEVSERAIRFAAAEADRFGEPLIAVGAWMPLTTPRNASATYPEGYLKNLAALTEETLALSLAGLARDYPDLEVIRVVDRGYPADVISRHATNARLVVVGTHGRGAVARFLLGSVSQEVLARLPTVTAVVR